MTVESSTVSSEPPGRHTEGLWAVSDVAAYLKCTTRQVWRYKKHHGLPFKRVGRRVLFRPAEVDAWVDSHGEAA